MSFISDWFFFATIYFIPSYFFQLSLILVLFLFTLFFFLPLFAPFFCLSSTFTCGLYDSLSFILPLLFSSWHFINYLYMFFYLFIGDILNCSLSFLYLDHSGFLAFFPLFIRATMTFLLLSCNSAFLTFFLIFIHTFSISRFLSFIYSWHSIILVFFRLFFRAILSAPAYFHLFILERLPFL